MKHTIFTPVYNRANNMFDLAKRIAEINYPRDEFEWIIVNDGSTDNTREALNLILYKYPELNIRCFHKENGGIHTAQNLAIKKAMGEYITRIDSDDYLLPNCLIEYDDALNTIPNSLSDEVAGVVGLCLNLKDMTIRGTKFPMDSQISKGYLLRKKGVMGDKNFCIKTSVMKNYLIPEYDDTKWVPEGGVLWLEIDKKYNTLFINIPIAVCSEPNIDSYLGSLKEISLSNFMSIYYSNIYIINEGKKYYPIKTILNSYINISYAMLGAQHFNSKKYHIYNIYSDIYRISDKIIATLSIPIAYYKYLQYRK